MLKELRNKKNLKKYLIALIILIIPAFFFWGVQSAKDASSYVVEAFDKRIGPSKFLRYINETRLGLMFSTGKRYVESKDFDIRRETLKRIVLIADAERQELTVSDTELAEYIQAIPYFQKDKKFNKELYFQVIDNYFKTDPKSFEEMIRGNMMIKKLFDSVTAETDVSEEELREIFWTEYTEYKVAYIKIPVEPDIEEPPEEKLKSYFEENKERYREPPKVKIRFVTFPAKENYPTIQKFRKFKSLQQVSELFSSPIQESEYFSLNDPIKPIGWQEEINRKAFSMEKGEISEPLFIGDNIFLIELTDRKPSAIPSFENMAKDLKEDYIQEKAIEKAMTEAAEVYGYLDKNDESILAKKSLPIQTTEKFKEPDYLPGIAQAVNVVEILEEAENGWSKPKLLANNVFMFKLGEKIEPEEEKFLEQKDELKTQILAFKKDMRFLAYMNSLFGNPKIKVSSELFAY